MLKESPLKAQEISKKLGLEKKKINAFLHSHKELFFQNDEYYWSLISPDELIVELSASGWIDCPALENSLKKADCLLDSNFSSIKFVVPRVDGILLEASARLLALCNQLAYAGKKIALDFTRCETTLTYLDRIGVFNQLDQRIKVLPDRPKNSRSVTYNGKSAALVEFGSIDPLKKNKELAIKLTETFVNQTGEAYKTVAYTIFAELIGNVGEHSQTPIPGFAALQIYKPKRKHIQTVVSDNGVGIAKTLRPSLRTHYPSLYRQYQQENIESDIALVIEAISQGEISRFGAGRGLGFKSTRKQAMKFDAKLSVRQATFAVMLQYKDGILSDIKKWKDLVPIHGTHICFDFFVD